MASSAATLRESFLKSGLVGRVTRWLDATPHPPIALEISPDRVAGARFHRAGSVSAFSEEPLPAGALVPSAIETNLVNQSALKSAVASVCNRLGVTDKDAYAALLLPDPVIRVFVQHFEDFPRTSQEAMPMLRWRLKKSVPFEVDETLLSYMRQAPRADGVDVVTAIARLRIIREYQALLEPLGLHPGVVLSSTLSAIALLDDRRPTLLARVSGTSLTTAIVREGVLAGYRCTELPVSAESVTPQVLLEEVFPLAAYFQDTWQEGIQSVRLAGLGNRMGQFTAPIQEEFKCEVHSLLSDVTSTGRVSDSARVLVDHELEGLVGWMLHHT